MPCSVSCLSRDTHCWARTPLMLSETSGTPLDTNGHQWTPMDINGHQNFSSVRRLPTKPAPGRATAGRHQLSWKFAPKMIYLELGGILETKLCASCNQNGHFFVNSSRAECFARFYASEKEAVIVATRAHKFSARFITPLLRLRLLKYNYAENPKARQKMPRASKLGWAFI